MKTQPALVKSKAVLRLGGSLPVLFSPVLENGSGLDDLAQLINRTYSASVQGAEGSRSAARYAIECAVQCGEYLRQAKAKMKHGELLPWLERNTEIHPRTARNYMRLHVWVGNHQKDILEHKPHSLRQFYILAGILAEDRAKQIPKERADELTKLRKLVRRTCLEAAAHRDYASAEALFKVLKPLATLLEEVSHDVARKNGKHVSVFD